MKTLVFIEKNPVTNRLRDVSTELVHKAHTLMAPLRGEVVGVYVGDELPIDNDKLFAYGAQRLLVAKQPQFRHFHNLAYRDALAQIVKRESPDIVLFGATHTGRELAPLLSASLGTGLTADCTQLHIDEYKDKGKILFQVRPAFGGNILATIITPDHRPMMATVRENVMPLPDTTLNNPIRIEEVTLNLVAAPLQNEFLRVVAKEQKVSFGHTDVIVAGGAGVGSKADFDLIHSLAQAMGAEVGASRAAVDFGYTSKDRMIGQTGAVVRPKVYIACGISGSIQHRAGMEEAKKIIAINSDPDAPIFKVAHLGIVGDLREIIPLMIKCIKEAG
jgi:electron transfer flavoprotein alpha subunit